MRKILLFLLPAAFLLIACGEDRMLEYADRVEANEWIYATMEENYFYASSMKTDKYWNAIPENFFVQVRSGSESRSGYNISQIYLGAEPSQFLSYGYFFDYYSYDSLDCVRVLYVAPGSPASEAGLRKGDWIIGFDGKKIGSKNYSELSDTEGGAHILTIGKVIGVSEKNQPILREEKQLSLPAPRILTTSPVEKDTILDLFDRKVGYLLYTRFESGPEGENSMEGTFNQDLRRVCADFSAKGVKELVLDLRYTTGDAFYCAQLLGTMLAPANVNNKMFFNIGDRNRNYRHYYFEPSSIGEGANLNFSSLFIIATPRTKGAAELLMHSLSRYMKVMIIGGKTAGYDLIAQTFSDNEFGLTLKLATHILVSSDSANYSTGITPKATVTEKDSLKYPYPVYTFGDPRELLLRRTLKVMGDSIASWEGKKEEEPDDQE